MTHEHHCSLEQAREYLGRKVNLIIDRPLGSTHPEHEFPYLANYGYIPNTVAPDGEGIDAYFLGVNSALDTAEGICIAIVHRLDDNDDSLVVVPEGQDVDDQKIRETVEFQEKFFDFKILRE